MYSFCVTAAIFQLRFHGPGRLSDYHPSPGVRAHLCHGSGTAEPSAHQQPVFRSGVELVTVDVTVVDDVGNPIENLSAESFDVRVDGEPRRVVSADYVRYRSASGVVPLSGVEFSSNENIDPGRLILIAVDRAHIRRVEGLAALRAATNFVDALEPADRVAAAPLDHNGPDSVHQRAREVKSATSSASADDASTHPTEFNIGLDEALRSATGGAAGSDQVVLPRMRRALDDIGEPAATRRERRAQRPVPDAGRAGEPGRRAGVAHRVASLARGVGQSDRTARVNRRSQDARARVGRARRRAAIVRPDTDRRRRAGGASDDLRSAARRADRRSVGYESLAERPARSSAARRRIGAAGGQRARRAVSAGGRRPVSVSQNPARALAAILVAFEATTADRDGRTHRIASGRAQRARDASRRPPSQSPGRATGHAGRAARRDSFATRAWRPNCRCAWRRTLSETPRATRFRVVLGAETDLGVAAGATIGFVLTDANGVIVASGAALYRGRQVHPSHHHPTGGVCAQSRRRQRRRQAGQRRAPVRGAHTGRQGDLRVSDLMLAEQSGRQAEPLQTRDPASRQQSTRGLSGDLRAGGLEGGGGERCVRRDSGG